MKNGNNCQNSKGKGVALIAVLWIVATLSIIVAGISYSVRQELRQMSLYREMVQSKAQSEAAMSLVLQQMIASAQRPNKIISVDLVYQGQGIKLQIMPMSGLIDINNASQPLLAALFERGAGMDPAAAEELAKNVVDARTKLDRQGRALRFDAIQDLLRVPGVDYALYARLAPLVTAEATGSGKVNPLAAPENVLQVLAGDNARAVADFIVARATEVAGLDLTLFDNRFVDTATTQRFRLQTKIPLSSGLFSLATCSVDLSARSQDGMPWRIFRCSHQLAANPGKGL